MPKKLAQMPMCTYGAGCTRKNCIYRHPPKVAVVKSDEICKPFLAGLCAFGSRCHNRHPSREEADSLRRRYANTVCQWGENCRSEGCLFRHPWDDAGWEDAGQYDGPSGHYDGSGGQYEDNGQYEGGGYVGSYVGGNGCCL